MLLAATLHFTLPAYQTLPPSCDSLDTMNAEGPLEAILERLVPSSPDWQTVATYPGLMPGSRDSITVSVSGCQPCAYRISLRDVAGNVGCPSNAVNVWETTPPVAVPPAQPPRRELFDLAGRKVSQPARSGVYFERVLSADGRRLKRIVVIR